MRMILGIQMFRFLAALFVVLGHSCWELGRLPIGYFGVDIFFVISGFIMSYITHHDTSLFMRKRVIRIVPLYWLSTLLIASLVYFSSVVKVSFDVQVLLSSLFFIPWWNGETLYQPMLPLGWTLNFEMFFYLLFFVAMKISHQHREAVCSALLCLIIAGVQLAGLPESSSLSFYGDTLSLEFIFGMFLAVLYRAEKLPTLGQSTAANALMVTVSLAAMVVGAMYTFDESLNVFHTLPLTESFGLPRFVYWGVPALLIVWGLLNLEDTIQALGASAKRLILVGGELSYPLYLVHIYCVGMFGRVIGVELQVYQLFLGATVISLVISLFLSRAFDRPLRRVLNRWVLGKRPA